MPGSRSIWSCILLPVCPPDRRPITSRRNCLWRGLPHRLSKRQSLSTTAVLFRTTFTRMIKLNLLLKCLIIIEAFFSLLFISFFFLAFYFTCLIISFYKKKTTTTNRPHTHTRTHTHKKNIWLGDDRDWSIIPISYHDYNFTSYFHSAVHLGLVK